MVLEATMILVDSSEYTRNGDFLTSRFDAQLDSVDYIFQSKTNSNPENTVGLMSMGGDGPKVLSTLTTDFGRILAGIHEVNIDGKLHLSTSIQVALLVLKHRQNKVQHQRVIAFVASPIAESDKDLEKLAKKLKKNNIAVDFINFGEESLNTSKLEKFIEIVNKDDNSHLLTVSPGPKLLYEHIASSPILQNGGAAFGGEAGANDDFFDLGADPNMDPELALALRLSLEEERSRQEREQQDREKATKQQDQKLQDIQEEGVESSNKEKENENENENEKEKEKEDKEDEDAKMEDAQEDSK
ncbi:hypothetical protein PACTADRAFT_185053 [Pachysolen tannophilus NRRL Y-2460]|uniref:VWFA domain-containing protein n=1 Tax=Pachysolen tannophilus NRRL Y-2460 TaxID=669874 RepID=A0A1E4U352_PACTA|nr:hypothetical protein PACTADRAFT_185053 [Pachysolen tannophilus NRRL Y-2460]